MKKISPVLLFILFSAMAIGQGMEPLADTAGFISRLKEVSENTSSITADFEEEKHLSFLKEVQRSSGLFFYQAENKMRWEQSQPWEYIILVNGDEVRLQEKGKEKKIGGGQRVTTKIKDLLLTLIKGDFHDNKAFNTQYFQNDKLFIVELIPRDRKLSNVFEKVEMRFSKKDLNLEQLTFFEKEGDKSIMTFSNQIFNRDIAPEHFNKL